MASAVKQGWGDTRTESAIGGGPMSIAGQRYAKGLGTYDVMLDSTAMAGESEVTVTAGDATLTGKFPKTENWDDYKTASIGQLTFRQSGVFTLSFKPASVATWRPLNLRNVILKPSNK